MSHPFQNYVVCRNNFFKNPNKVLELFDEQTFTRSPIYPGKRTENLFKILDQDTQDFALYFANRIKSDVFPNIQNFMIDIRFHINDIYEHSDANVGWIHNDEADLAGVIYLNQHEINFNNGTSIFNKITEGEFIKDDFEARHQLNLHNNLTQSYLDEIHSNWNEFQETVRVGNQFNRLIAYDAKLFHRPNSFVTTTGELRKSIVFFIQGFSVPVMFDESKFNWKDNAA